MVVIVDTLPARPLMVLIEVAVILVPGDGVGDTGADGQTT